MQRKPVLGTEDTPFLSNNVLQDRNPCLSFYTLAVQQSGWERFGPETEHWVWALTRLAQTWIKSSWEGQRCWRTAYSASKGKDPPPACLCSPVYQASQFWLQVFYRWSLQPVSHTLMLPILILFFHCWRLSISHDCSCQRILLTVSPMQENIIISCRLVSISCFEDHLLISKFSS